MHERSLMRDLMSKVERIAAEQEARRVVGVRVWLGALSHMSPEHFREHFETASVGTLAEGAQVDCEPSDDLDHADAQDIRLVSIDVE
jgi:hydrogenase nickel incorporation protein HypA/HybF